MGTNGDHCNVVTSHHCNVVTLQWSPFLKIFYWQLPRALLVKPPLQNLKALDLLSQNDWFTHTIHTFIMAMQGELKCTTELYTVYYIISKRVFIVICTVKKHVPLCNEILPVLSTEGLRVEVWTVCAGGGWGLWGWRQLSCGLCSGRCSAERTVESWWSSLQSLQLFAGVCSPKQNCCHTRL